MPLIVTENAVITCIHSGEVTLSAKQHRVTIQGGAVLRVKPREHVLHDLHRRHRPRPKQVTLPP